MMPTWKKNNIRGISGFFSPLSCSIFGSILNIRNRITKLHWWHPYTYTTWSNFRKFWPHRGQTWSFGQPPLETTWSIHTIHKIFINICTIFITCWYNYIVIQKFVMLQLKLRIHSIIFWSDATYISVQVTTWSFRNPSPPPWLTTWYMDDPLLATWFLDGP